LGRVSGWEAVLGMGCGYVRILFALEKQGVGSGRAVAGSLLLGGGQRGQLLAAGLFIETLQTLGVQANAGEQDTASKGNKGYGRHG
jgi:hypothetical protein